MKDYYDGPLFVVGKQRGKAHEYLGRSAKEGLGTFAFSDSETAMFYANDRGDGYQVAELLSTLDAIQLFTELAILGSKYVIFFMPGQSEPFNAEIT